MLHARRDQDATVATGASGRLGAAAVTELLNAHLRDLRHHRPLLGREAQLEPRVIDAIP